MGYPGTLERGAAPHEGMSASRYAATRISTLKPPMLPVPNPWKLVRMLNRQQWAFFFLAFWAWVSLASIRLRFVQTWDDNCRSSADLHCRRPGTPLTSSPSPSP